jgi:O-antigen ligase
MQKIFNQKNIFINLPSIIIILLPFLLITGPLLSDLAVSFCALVFLINYISDRELKKYFNYKPFIILFFFWIYLILNSIFISKDIFLSLKNSLFYFRFGVFSLCVWYLIDKYENLIKYTFISILFCFLILLIDGYIQYFFGYNLIGLKIHDGPRISSFFGEELIYGSYLSRFLPILFGLMIFNYEKGKLDRNILFLTYLVFVLAEVAVFLSGERTAFFLINLGAILFILSSQNYKIIRSLIFIGSLIIIIILSFSQAETKKRMIDDTLEEMNITNDNFYAFSKTHHEHYKSALMMFKDHPIFGIGHKNFRLFCNDKKYKLSPNSCTTHPHNFYIQILTELGVVGIIFILPLTFIVFKILLTNILANIFRLKLKNQLNDFEICMVIALIISIWPLSPSGNPFNNWLSIIIYYPIGFILWSLNNNK